MKFSDQNWSMGLLINNPYILNAGIKFLCHKIVELTSELQEINFYYNTICFELRCYSSDPTSCGLYHVGIMSGNHTLPRCLDTSQ